MRIMAIDPGNVETAYVMMDGYKPIDFGKVKNDHALLALNCCASAGISRVAIEMIASYGMAVGKTVFDTCLWIGRYIERAVSLGLDAKLVYRMEVKMNLCHNAKAKDSNIRQALVDRFATHSASGKGTKKNPDFFYGFAADIWAAYGVGATYLDKQKEA